MIVPFPAGGGSDIVARAIGPKLASAVGQPVVIENRAGADGMIGAAQMARSPADGYTIVMGPITGGLFMLNVAVVGMGWWGQTLVTLIKKSSKLRVVKGMKRNPATAADFARAQEIEIVSDYAQVLKDPGVQGVVLCTPHTLHTGQIIAAAEAGKHVFCEKPLSTHRDSRYAVRRALRRLLQQGLD